MPEILLGDLIKNRRKDLNITQRNIATTPQKKYNL